MLRPFDDHPDARIVEAMVRALAEVLLVPARHCQMSALHGLGHLRHESKEEIIRVFIDNCRDSDNEIVEYAQKAIAGTVL
jgi:hypothetical protein